MGCVSVCLFTISNSGSLFISHGRTNSQQLLNSLFSGVRDSVRMIQHAIYPRHMTFSSKVIV